MTTEPPNPAAPSEQALLEAKGIKAAFKSYQKKYHKDMEKQWVAYVEALFKENPALNIIVILGSTPSWNDGDECLHTEEICIHPDALESCWEELNEDDCQEDQPSWVRANAELPNKTIISLEKGISSFEDARHSLYKTDWQLWIERSSTGVKFRRMRYDCGR